MPGMTGRWPVGAGHDGCVVGTENSGSIERSCGADKVVSGEEFEVFFLVSSLFIGVETRAAETGCVIKDGVVEKEECTASSSRVVVFDSDSDEIEFFTAAMYEVAEIVGRADQAGSGTESAEKTF